MRNVQLSKWGMIGLLAVVYTGLACSNAEFRNLTEQQQDADARGASGPAGIKTQTLDSTQSTIDAPMKASVKQYLSTTQTFPVSTRRDGKLAVAAKRNEYSRDLQLQAEYRDVRTNYAQIVRPTETRMFKQGVSTLLDRVEYFDQTALGVLDLQIVIDNSRSMDPYQRQLAGRLQPLLKFLSNTDWQINIVTTDPADGCSRRLIRRGDANADTAFREGVSAGINGADVEQGIRMARAGLECSTTRWVRNNSSVAVLIVSDEDNCNNNGAGCAGYPWASSNYLTDFLSGGMGRTLGKDARIYGIIRIPSAYCPKSPQSPQYEAAIQAGYGRQGAICDSDYTATLEGISADMASILKQEFRLSQTPSPGTLQVSVNGVVQPATAYTVMGQLVRFNDNAKPSFGAKITASYKVKIDAPMISSYPLGEQPLPGSVSVLFNGALVNPAYYSIDAANQINFNPIPPEGAEVRVTFKKNLALINSFGLDYRYLRDTIQAKINGAASAFSLSNSVLSFSSPAPEGALIEISYRMRVGPILQYPLAPTGMAIQFLGLFDKATGQRLNASLVQGQVVVAAADFVEGRRVIAKYLNETSGLSQIELPQLPIADSVKLKTSAGSCSFQQQEQMVVANCTGAETANLELSWSYYTPKVKEFKLEGVTDPETTQWLVSINNQPTQAFTREGTTIRISSELDYEDQVSITVTAPE